MTISANDLKTKGISLLDNLLSTLDEVLISVRGKTKYVVVDMERYEYLRECELEQACREAQADIKAGRSKTMSAEEHLKELDDALQD
ncbi:HigA protein (antitoxin to HigB) [hydrothermal vent metagenome]|uniref:HigA protein (Antitoxin to HigB) n=1 Tax=hydrothermal vent metagenome TaxID=652676 RepID=A0A1W1E7I3_9ZZZZ